MVPLLHACGGVDYSTYIYNDPVIQSFRSHSRIRDLGLSNCRLCYGHVIFKK